MTAEPSRSGTGYQTVGGSKTGENGSPRRTKDETPNRETIPQGLNSALRTTIRKRLFGGSKSMRATRNVSTRVFPEPGPARTAAVLGSTQPPSLDVRLSLLSRASSITFSQLDSLVHEISKQFWYRLGVHLLDHFLDHHRFWRVVYCLQNLVPVERIAFFRSDCHLLLL